MKIKSSRYFWPIFWNWPMDEDRSPLIRTDSYKYTHGEGKIPNKRIRPLFSPLIRYLASFLFLSYFILNCWAKAWKRKYVMAILLIECPNVVSQCRFAGWFAPFISSKIPSFRHFTRSFYFSAFLSFYHAPEKQHLRLRCSFPRELSSREDRFFRSKAPQMIGTTARILPYFFYFSFG